MRRRSLVGLLIMIAALGLAACGGDDENTTEAALSDYPPITEPPADAQDGGTIEVIAADDVDFIDPGAMYYQFSYMVARPMHRALMGWPPDVTEEPVPDLAEAEPEISEDERTIAFTIRDGVRFSPPVDREVTAADVEYAIERSLLPGVANNYVHIYLTSVAGFDEAVDATKTDETVAPEISGITATDDRTLEIKLDEPAAKTVVQALSLPVSAPVPEEYAKQFDAENPSTYGGNQVATGPYMIENDAAGEAIGYEPGKEIRIVRNPNWEPDTDFRPAFVDEIVVREGFTDVNSAIRKILAGESQVNGDIIPEPEALKLAAQDYPDQLSLTPSGGNRYISLNTTVPPLDDLNVRRAIVAAADRTALRLERGGEIVGPVASHFIPPGMPGFEEAGGEAGPELDFLASPEGDPELAAEYMRKAGYESGKYEGDEEILMVAENAGLDSRVGEAALDVFEELGFEVDYREVGGGVLYTKFCVRPDADVAVCPTLGWGRDFNDAQTILDPTFNGEAIQESNNVNHAELDDPEINAAMEEARLINNPDERAEAWGKIDQMVIEQAPAVPYLWDNQANVSSANVNAVVNLFDVVIDLSFTSLDPEGS